MKATIKISNLEGKHTTGKVVYTSYGNGQIFMTVHRKGYKSNGMHFDSHLNAKEYAEMMVQIMAESGNDWKLVNIK